MHYKYFLAIFVFSLFYILFPRPIFAQTPMPLLILQQIRGNDTCCEAGSSEMVAEINSQEQFQKLPLGWALRYDVLTNGQLLTSYLSLPPSQQVGALLEVTPQLAKDSGVTYKGDIAGSDWFNGKNAFLIGYSQGERKKIIDQLFSTFYKIFHSYPSFTVSWMIDSWSLNYINSQYGVMLHEITKEQYETDSYTLYGGIFNIPYYPSLTHPLIPASPTETRSILVVRQTISDISQNYGSAKTYFTSQPNDYLSNPYGGGSSYFRQLMDQMESQEEESRFGVIGLENSNEWRSSHAEYLKQVTSLVDEQKKGTIQIVAPGEYVKNYQEKYPNNQPRIIKSADFPQHGVLWYFGQNYRARLEIQKNLLELVDFRIYSNFVDPYGSQPASASQSYWIIPYLLDSSQEFIPDTQDDKYYANDPVRTDSHVSRLGLILLDDPQTFKNENNVITITGKQGKVLLTSSEMMVENSQPKFSQFIDTSFDQLMRQHSQQTFAIPRHLPFFVDTASGELHFGWQNQNKESITMASISYENNVWHLIPNTNLTQGEIDSLSPLFQPDRSPLPVDIKSSTFFWHNTEAIAGRNPVRLYVVLHNYLMRPVVASDFHVLVTGTNAVQIGSPADLVSKMEPFLIDFTASQKSQGTVKLIQEGKTIATKQVTFYVDCQKNKTTCLKDIPQAFGFMKIIVSEQIGGILEKVRTLIHH